MSERIDTDRLRSTTIREIEEILRSGGDILDYGLSLDYVEAGTFANQPLGYCRWQLSFGSTPSEEFRFYNPPWVTIEYAVLGWAGEISVIELRGHQRRVLLEVWDLLSEFVSFGE